MLSALFVWGTERTGLFKDDTAYYGRLAENLADPARLPYTFRLLTPWLVSLMPLETASAFSVVTLVSLWVTTLMLNLLLQRLGCGSRARWGALTVFLFSAVVVRMLTTPTYVDPLTYALTVTSLLALLAQRDVAFCVLITLSVLNRETAIILLPAYFVARWPFRDAAAAVRSALVCAVPCLVLASVVLGKLAVLGLLSDGLAGLISLRYGGYVQRVPRLGDLLDLYSLFGVAWIALLLGWRWAPRWLQVYGALIVAQLLVSRGDESRNLSHLFPLVIPLVGILLERLASSGRAMMVAFVLCAVASMVHFRWIWIPIDLARYALVGAGTLAGLALVFWSWRSYRHPVNGIAEAGVSSGA
ncbi:MAG: hypothetical protein ACKVVP_22185 [Chloroflexota bacterium]